MIEGATRGGPLALVCSNAGVGRNRRVLKETNAEDIERVLAVNFLTGVRIAQAYALACGRGRILFTASENALSVPAGVKGFGLGIYAASKHALLAAAEWLRDEADQLDVHVLLPGPVYTPLVAHALPDPAQAPPGLHLISSEHCAKIALSGLDLGLFYIPTHAHIVDDLGPRVAAIRDAAQALGLR